MFSRLQLLAKLRELLSELLGFLGSEPELKTSRLLRASERGEQAPPISPLAMEAVKRTDALFDIERGINGESAEKRLAVRRDLSAPLVVDLEDWMRTERDRDASTRCRSPCWNWLPRPMTGQAFDLLGISA